MNRRKKIIISTISISLCICILILVFILANKNRFNFENETGNKMVNVCFGGMYSAYHEGFIYYSGQDGIYEYDVDNNEAIRIKEGEFSDINAVKDGLIVTDYSGLKKTVFMDYNGKELFSLNMENGNMSGWLFVADDNFIYYFDGESSGMGRYNVKEKTKEIVCKNSHSFNLYGEYIYFLQESNPYVINRALKTDISKTEEMKLDFKILGMCVFEQGTISVADEVGNQYHIRWNGEVENWIGAKIMGLYRYMKTNTCMIEMKRYIWLP